MIERILSTLSNLRELKERFYNNDDSVDRLHRHYTCCLLLASASLVSLKQYAGAPIDCWCPAHFTQSHVDYANSICWVNGTYYVSFEETVPLPGQPRSAIFYYQWVPFLFLLQGFIFAFPGLLWRFASKRIGLDLASVVRLVKTTSALYASSSELCFDGNTAGQMNLRRATLYISTYLRRGFKSVRQRNVYESRVNFSSNHANHYDTVAAKHTSLGFKKSAKRCLCWFTNYFCCSCGKGICTNCLYCFYVWLKLLNLVNVCFQFLALDSFLSKTTLDNLLSLSTLPSARTWLANLWMFQLDPDRFPKVTMCDFHVRQQVNLHRYTVQCVLPINLFNEKIFLLLWFWFAVLVLVTMLNAFFWIFRMVFLSLQVNYIKEKLQSVVETERLDRRAVGRFVYSYLGKDGIMAVRIIAANVGEVEVALVIHGLWQDYKQLRLDKMHQRQRKLERNHSKISQEQIEVSPFWRILRHRKKETCYSERGSTNVPEEV